MLVAGGDIQPSKTPPNIHEDEGLMIYSPRLQPRCWEKPVEKDERGGGEVLLKVLGAYGNAR